MTNPPIPIIQAKNISYSYQSTTIPINILKDINLIIQPSDCVAITGPSGTGKTTLLSLLAALDTPTKGEIFILGKNITKYSEEQRARIRAEQIGFIFQHFHLLSYLSAIDNISLPLELKGIKNSSEIAKYWLEQTGIIDRRDHLPSQLSGGEMQRVAIARAFALQPNILFADEPTGNLDSKTALSITNLLFKLNDTQNTTLVIVTHNPQLANRCRTNYSLANGTLQ